jgi:hypothetical protein
MKNPHKILIENLEGRRRPFRRPQTRWAGDIKMDVNEIVLKGANWINVVQERDGWRALVNTVTNLWAP